MNRKLRNHAKLVRRKVLAHLDPELDPKSIYVITIRATATHPERVAAIQCHDGALHRSGAVGHFTVGRGCAVTPYEPSISPSKSPLLGLLARKQGACDER